jgi:predicted RNA binding protein YcfA (HicA-like mRNA interferase family)
VVAVRWKAVKARQLFRALERLGWRCVRIVGSHRTMARPGWPPITFAFHDRDEVGGAMLAKIAKKTGLRVDDLQELPS